MADKYPEGKFIQDDEGELELKIAPCDGRVIMSWGKAVSWVGFTPSGARDAAKALIKNAEEAERQIAHQSRSIPILRNSSPASLQLVCQASIINESITDVLKLLDLIIPPPLVRIWRIIRVPSL
jgi:hypothetical protein